MFWNLVASLCNESQLVTPKAQYEEYFRRITPIKKTSKSEDYEVFSRLSLPKGPDDFVQCRALVASHRD